jgi:uncharacterized protein involved in cysteine biosynthesis
MQELSLRLFLTRKLLQIIPGFNSLVQFIFLESEGQLMYCTEFFNPAKDEKVYKTTYHIINHIQFIYASINYTR